MSETKNRNKTRLIMSICLCLLLFIMAFALFGCGHKSSSGENTEQTDVFDANAILKYDQKEISLDTLKTVQIDNSITVESAVKKSSSSSTATFKPGLPQKTGNFWIRLTFSDKTVKIIEVTVIDTSYRIEEINVIYNQGTHDGYFTSFMDPAEVEFEVMCFVGKQAVNGTATLNEDKLVPAISTYHYTFVPDEQHASLGTLTGEVEIEVYASIGYYQGGNLIYHSEVPYNSLFDVRDIKQTPGYEMPYWADDNNVKYTSQSRVTGDMMVNYHEDMITYVINYHLDGGVNATDNKDSYTIESSSFVLTPASKDNYRFIAWYTTPSFDPDSQIAYMEIMSLKNYDLYSKYEPVKTEPTVNVTPLNLVYNGSSQALANITADGGTVFYFYNDGNNLQPETKIDAGTYSVTYWVKGDTFHTDTEKETFEVTIAKAKYNTSNIVFENKTVVYDGQPHSITNSGTKPTDYVLEYSGNGQVNAGEYDIVMNFTGVDTKNYEILESRTKRLTILRADPVYTAPTIKSLTYSGAAQALLNAGTSSNGVFSYSLDNATWIDTIPTTINAGDYTVYYKLSGNSNYNEVESSLQVTIDKAQYDMDSVTFANGSKVYNKNPQGLEISGDLPNGVEVSYFGIATNVGTYTITAKFTGDANNYELIDDMTATLTITKANLSSSIPTGIENLVYTGSAQALVEGGTIDNGSIQYSLDGQTYSDEIATGTNAIIYNVYYKFVYDEANYIPDNIDGSIQVSIANATLTMVSPNGFTGKYSAGVYHSIANNPTANTVDGSNVTWVFSTDMTNWVDDIQVSEINESTSDICKYYFKATAANHDIVTGEVIVSITAKDAANINITNINSLFKTYDGLAIGDPIIETNSSGAQNITYSSGSKPINAGIYTITVEYGECDDYALTTKTFTIEIYKATLSITGIVIEDKSYDQSTDATIANLGTLLGVATGEEITLVTSNVTAIFKSANANQNAEVLVQGYSLLGDTIANYSFATSYTVYATISKALWSITAPSAKTLSYTGYSLELINGGSGAPITYSLNDGAYSSTIPSATNHTNDPYVVKYKFDVDTVNYDTNDVATSGTINVAIAKATVGYELPTAKSLTYTSSAQELVTAGSIEIPGASVEYSLNNGTYTTIIPRGTNAGSYTVKYKFVCDTNNYNVPAEATINISIAKANPSYTVPTNIETIEGRSLSQVVLPSGFTFQDSASTSVGAVGNNTFKVRFTPSDTANYNIVNNIDVTVNVKVRYKLVIECSAGQSTTYTAGSHGPVITVKANNEIITDGFTPTYAYRLTTSSNYTNNLPVNAGTYYIKINASGYDYSDADEVVVTFTINKAVLTVKTSTISIDYNSSTRAWSNISSTISSGVTYSGLIGSDATSITVNGMHNGKYKYGTVSGSYIAPTSDATFSSSYNNVIGSTYLAYITPNNANYTLSKDYVLVKYKTAMVGSTYYTIEDAISSGSTTITFAGDLSSDTSYVATMFSALATSYTGYSTTYSFSGSKSLMVPYKNSSTAYEYAEWAEGLSNKVYSALIIPENITLNVESGAMITVGAYIAYKQPKTTGVYDRGILINNGTINVGSSSSYKSYGFTKGTGTINFASGSTALDVMATYDWPGGNTATNLDDTLPLNAWTFHNIACVSYIYYGAKYYTQLYAVASSTNIWKDVCLVSSSSSDTPLFVMSSGYIKKYAIKAASWAESYSDLIAIVGSNQVAGQKDILELNGNVVDSALTISVSGFSIATSTSICCPMGFTDIYIKSGASLTLSKSDYLFLPGTKMVIESGATVTTNSGVDLSFELVANMNSTGYEHTTYSFASICVDKTDAYLEVNGTLVCKGNIGGKITTKSTSAVLNLTNATLTSTHRSLTNAVGASASSSSPCAYMVTGLPAQGYINSTSTIYAFTQSTYSGQLSGTTYIWSGAQGASNPGNGTLSTTEEVSGCIIAGTRVLLADGSWIKVEDIKAGDYLLVFNHETGEYDVSIVVFNDTDEEMEVDVINLYFSDGTYIGVVSEHGFFDMDLMQYVYITKYNYLDFVGHRFYSINGIYTLDGAYVTKQIVRFYSPVTAVTLNYFVEGFLSMPGGIPGLFNIFAYSKENLQYDQELMAQDIETYGLFTYEDFKDYIPYEIYEVFNGAYLKVAIGKGILTFEDVLYYVERYSIYW